WLSGISSEQHLYSLRDGNFALTFLGGLDKETREAADAILERFGEDWSLGDSSFRLDVVVSIIRVPEDVSTLDDLMVLLTSGYNKTGIGSGIVSFEELSAYRYEQRIELILRDAVKSGKLQVWYQPIWSIKKDCPVAAEAILQVDCEELRGVSPDIFYPIAEKCGMIREMGIFVFEEVCRFIQSGQMERLGLSYMELDVSVYQFVFDDVVERFETIRTKYGVSAHAINLEVTESAAFGDTPVVRQTMEALQALGYHISLKGFGVGYSNLHNLVHSNFMNIKMDKILLWDARRSKASELLLDSLYFATNRLGCYVVQDGVDTLQQLQWIKDRGASMASGLYFSRPLEEGAFLSYMESERERA
ncbi:MAG: EAL domain-containing protein, partial [Lachnospiraceae bacterium]|nr:EAL domain-containing protein [Lachnospiraceae bacterium]